MPTSTRHRTQDKTMPKRQRDDERKPPMSALAARRLRSHQNVELPEAQSESSGEEIRGRREEIEVGLKDKRVIVSHVEIPSSTAAAVAVALAEKRRNGDVEMEMGVDKEIRMSNFTPTPENYVPNEDGSCVVRIVPGEMVVVLGEYGLSVRKGVVKISGARITSGDGECRVFAPSTHALPGIECARTGGKGRGKREGDEAEVLITQTESGVRELGRTCAVASGIWTPVGGGEGEGRSFHPLFTTSTPLPILTISKSWKDTLGKIEKSAADADITTPPVILLSGGKSVGKSTLSRILTNQLITSGACQGVYYLDVDPGQPSFTPPGFLSLHMLKKPILGPPFTSPSLPKHPIAAHHIGYTTPREDPSAYIRAILALLSDYRSAVASEPGPLVINSAGWTKALGLELLQEIIAASCVSEIIFITSALDNSIPITSVLPLTNPPQVHVLESSAGEGSKFTAADLRSLQISSFLHYSPDTLRWAGTPLSALKPWRLPYAGAQAAIHGISLLQEEDLSPDELLTAIDGTLVAILEIDDDLDLDSAIITTKENLPYLPIPPPPERSRALGMALVKGVDVQKMEIWIVATMGVGEVQGLAGKRTVLVRGRLELSIGEVVAGVEEFGGADRGGVPWVSFAGRGGSGDGKGAGAWRVRRNLMRRGQQQG